MPILATRNNAQNSAQPTVSLCIQTLWPFKLASPISHLHLMTASAFVYTRMSSHEQLRGDSLRRQLSAATQYAEAHGLELIPIEDHGVSAFRGANARLGNLSNFLDKIKNSRIPKGSYLIVESLDRISREDVSSALQLLLSIINGGITVVTLFDQQEYSPASIVNGPMALMLALVSFATAGEESRKKSVRLKAVWAQKKQVSRETRRPPTSMVPSWLTLTADRSGYELIERRVALVKEMFHLATAGFGALSIAARFNERKEPLWHPEKNTTGVWHDSYIKKVLCSRAVLGEYQPHRNTHDDTGRKSREPDGAPIEDHYPRIIDPFTFAKAAADSAQRRTSGRGRKGTTYANLFTGLLKCECGAGMQYSDKGKGPKGGQYLRCAASLAKGICKAKAFRYAKVEEYLLRKFEGLDLEAALGLDSSDSKLVALNEQLSAATVAELDTKTKTSRMLALYMAGGDSPVESVSAALASLQTEAQELEQTIHRLNGEIEFIKRADPEAQRVLLDKLISGVQHNTGDDAALARRALANEIKKIVKRITFTLESRNVYESDTSSDVTGEQDQNLAEIAYVQVIRVLYQSGMVQILEPEFSRNMKLEPSKKHVAMLARIRAFERHKLR